MKKIGRPRKEGQVVFYERCTPEKKEWFKEKSKEFKENEKNI